MYIDTAAVIYGVWPDLVGWLAAIVSVLSVVYAADNSFAADCGRRLQTTQADAGALLRGDGFVPVLCGDCFSLLLRIEYRLNIADGLGLIIFA